MKTSTPFEQISSPETIRDKLCAYDSKKNSHPILAVVDVLMQRDILKGASRIISCFDVRIDPLPVGYLVPQDDDLYHEVMDSVVKSTLLTEDGKWCKDFRTLMTQAAVNLYEEGPKLVEISGGVTDNSNVLPFKKPQLMK